jgi:hypothetical protein
MLSLGYEQTEGFWATGRQEYLGMQRIMRQDSGEDRIIKTLIMSRVFKSREMERSDMQCRLLDNN